VRALVYLARDGVRVAVTRQVPAPAGPKEVLQALLAGPSPREREAGLITAVSVTASIAGRSGALLQVDVPAGNEQPSGRNDEVLGFGQIVITLTALTGVEAVQFMRDAQPLPVPRGDGSLSSAPLTRPDYTNLL
jgi:spore germination protein GerM